MRADGYPLVLPRREDITAVAVTVSAEHITVLFASGMTASRPLAYSTRLAAASAAEREQGQVIGSQHLRWEAIDEDLDAIAFLGFPEDLGLAVISSIEAEVKA